MYSLHFFLLPSLTRQPILDWLLFITDFSLPSSLTEPPIVTSHRELLSHTTNSLHYFIQLSTFSCTGILPPLTVSHFLSHFKTSDSLVSLCFSTLPRAITDSFGLKVSLYTSMYNSIYSHLKWFDRPLPFNHFVIST